eukprot:g29906.t1
MNAIYEFANNTTVVGWISNSDESKYRREIEGLVTWCKENSLSLSVGKTKELIIGFSKKGGEHIPIYINRAEVEMVKSIKFLGVKITDELSCTSHIDATVKKAQHHLFFLSILSGRVSAWYGNCSAQDCEKLQKVVCTAQNITEANLPSMDSVYMARCYGKATNIIKDPLHPAKLFQYSCNTGIYPSMWKIAQ